MKTFVSSLNPIQHAKKFNPVAGILVILSALALGFYIVSAFATVSVGTTVPLVSLNQMTFTAYGANWHTTNDQEFNQAYSAWYPNVAIQPTVAWINQTQVPGTVPLYRSHHPVYVKWFFGTKAEIDNQVACGCYPNVDGIIGYVHTNQVPDTVPLYRVSNGATGDNALSINVGGTRVGYAYRNSLPPSLALTALQTYQQNPTAYRGSESPVQEEPDQEFLKTEEGQRLTSLLEEQSGTGSTVPDCQSGIANVGVSAPASGKGNFAFCVRDITKSGVAQLLSGATVLIASTNGSGTCQTSGAGSGSSGATLGKAVIYSCTPGTYRVTGLTRSAFSIADGSAAGGAAAGATFTATSGRVTKVDVGMKPGAPPVPASATLRSDSAITARAVELSTGRIISNLTFRATPPSGMTGCSSSTAVTNSSGEAKFTNCAVGLDGRQYTVAHSSSGSCWAADRTVTFNLTTANTTTSPRIVSINFNRVSSSSCSGTVSSPTSTTTSTPTSSSNDDDDDEPRASASVYQDPGISGTGGTSAGSTSGSTTSSTCSTSSSPACRTVGGINWSWPISKSYSCSGWWSEPRPGHLHTGIDVGAPQGVSVRSVAKGTIIRAVRNERGYGNYVIMSHGSGKYSLYGHLSSITRTSGSISRNVEVGKVGNSGGSYPMHLHFNIQSVNHSGSDVGAGALNPMNYLPRDGRSGRCSP